VLRKKQIDNDEQVWHRKFCRWYCSGILLADHKPNKTALADSVDMCYEEKSAGDIGLLYTIDW